MHDGVLEDSPNAVWLVKAGRYVAQLVAPARISTALREVLTDLSVSQSGAEPGLIVIQEGTAGGFDIRADGRLWDDGVPEADVVDSVVRMLMLASLDAHKGQVHVHAGAVSRDGKTAVIAGLPGAGKSTVIAVLLEAGFDYLTDERLAVSSRGTSISSFPKPVSLVVGSFRRLAHLNPQRTGVGATNGTVWQIPASSIGDGSIRTSATPSVVIFIRYASDAATTETIVPPLEAAMRLIGDSPDVIIRGRRGVAAIVALCLSVPCLEISFDDTSEALALVTGALSRDLSTNYGHVVIVDSDPNANHLESSSPANDFYAPLSDVSAWILDGSGFAYASSTGRVVELNEMSSVWLQLIGGGGATLEDLVRDVAAETGIDPSEVRRAALQVVTGLVEAGVVSDSPKC